MHEPVGQMEIRSWKEQGRLYLRQIPRAEARDMETEKTGNNVRAHHRPTTATEPEEPWRHQPALVTGGEWTGSPSPGSDEGGRWHPSTRIRKEAGAAMLPSDRINVRSRKVTGDKDGRLIPRKGNPSRPSSTRYSVCARRRSQNTEQPTAVRAGTRSSTCRGGFPLKPHPRRTDDPREDGGRSIQSTWRAVQHR